MDQHDFVVENLKSALSSFAPTWKLRGAGKLLVLNEEGKAVGYLHLEEIPRVESLPAAVDPSEL